MRNKGQLLHDFVNLNSCDVFGLCETHIKPNDTPSFLSELSPPGFSLFQTPRVGKPGGGVGFLVRKVFDYHQINAPTFSTFECIVISVQYSNHCINLASIYKPPEKSMPLFRNEFASFSGYLSTLPSTTVITGDFNIHWDVDDSCKQDFQLVLEACNLTQFVNFPTQIHGHTLDFIVAPSNFNGISSVRND